jgi:hypothetical protein
VKVHVEVYAKSSGRATYELQLSSISSLSLFSSCVPSPLNLLLGVRRLRPTVVREQQVLSNVQGLLRPCVPTRGLRYPEGE